MLSSEENYDYHADTYTNLYWYQTRSTKIAEIVLCNQIYVEFIMDYAIAVQRLITTEFNTQKKKI